MHTTLFDGTGRFLWASFFDAAHTEETCAGMLAWDLCEGSHREDVMLAFARALIAGEPVRATAPFAGQAYHCEFERIDGAQVVTRWHAHSDVAFTPREREVLLLVCEGHKAQAIAKKLSISESTYETYRAHVQAKIGTHSTAAMVRWAIRHGLLPP